MKALKMFSVASWDTIP